MYTLTVIYPVWTIDYETFRGKGSSFSVDYGPFGSEQQARWFWLIIKEKMKRNYDIAVILDENNNECYIDEMGM